MASISTYPIGTPLLTDLIPGSQRLTDEDGKEQIYTKNFTLSSIVALATPDLTTIATTTQQGVVKLGSDTKLTQTYETGVTGVASRTYPVQLNASNQMAVSVPWTAAGSVTSVGLATGTSGTDVNVSGSPVTASGDITLNIPTASGSNTGKLSSTDWTTFNGKQDSITLTTTGTSGAATFVGNTLNIPQYSGGGGSGDLTEIQTTTSSQLTITNGTGPIPSLAIVTGAVVNGGTALATGDQIYDATTTRLADYLPLAGGTMTGNIVMTDSGALSSKIVLGASTDAEIYYDTAEQSSLMVTAKTGDLRLTSEADDIVLSAVDDIALLVKGNEYGIWAKADAGVELYYDNSKKFETTTSGITVTGVAVCDGLDLGDGERIRLGDGNDFQITHIAGSYDLIDSGGTELKIESTGTVGFYKDGLGETMAEFVPDGKVGLYYDNTETFYTQAQGVTIAGNCDLGDNKKVRLGDSQDGEIYYDGAKLFMDALSSGIKIRGALVQLMGTSEYYMECNENAEVSIRYNNSKKWETTNTGTKTTGQMDLAALNSAPSSASDTGVTGEIRFTADYIYVCVGTNTWKRAALATW